MIHWEYADLCRCRGNKLENLHRSGFMQAKHSILLKALFHFRCDSPFARKISTLLASRNVCLHVAFSMLSLSQKSHQNYLEVIEKSKRAALLLVLMLSFVCHGRLSRLGYETNRFLSSYR